jgi:nucleoside-diphosphate-sugar epimerase
MKIAVAGSKGFIGKHLIKCIESLPDTSVIPIDIIDGMDLTDISILEKIPAFDAFIYLAGLSFIPDSFTRPQEFYKTNFLLTLNSLELCRKYQAKMIMISSYVYGEPLYLPIDEEHPIKASNPYMQTKIISEQLCQGYNRDFGISCTVLRPFNIYGPGHSSRFLIPAIISQLKSGCRTIELFDSHPRRDFVYVTDLCDAIIKAALCNETHFETYNVASGDSYSVEQIASLILEIYGDGDISLKFRQADKRKNDIMEVCGSYARINQSLGWVPKTNLQDGLNLTLNA